MAYSPIQDVIIVTCTYYKSKEEVRFKLACDTIHRARVFGLTVVVVDNSPDRTIVEEFKNLGAIVFRQQTKGMGTSRCEAVSYALRTFPEKRVIVWIEPEKADMIKFIIDLAMPILSGNADIVHAGRTEKSWLTYPEFQRQTEILVNKEWAEMMGHPSCSDLMFGPVAFARNLAISFMLFQHLKDFGVNYDNCVQLYVSALAKLYGARFAYVKVDFIYPSSQREEEETTLSGEMGKKRLWQSRVVLNGIKKIIKQVSVNIPC